ncbi:MAG: DUF192 domain-containing protein [Actinobacteria bacterium]|nr:DUF192 domain-containing protein [Actinomycetota bacterium]
MPWLMRDGLVLASLEEASSWAARARGLLGREGINGVLLLRPAMSVHTLGMRFPLDVAFCDADMVVIAMVHMAPWRLGRPRRRARCVIEAEAGVFDAWELRVGDQLEVQG